MSYYCLKCARKADQPYCDGCRKNFQTKARAGRKEEMKTAMKKAGVPEQYRGVRLTLEQCDLIRDSRLTRDNDCLGFLFYGPPGVGKTHLAAALLRENLDKAVNRNLESPNSFWWLDTLFVRSDEFLKTLRAMMMDGEELQGVKRLGSVPFLVIDDFGSEKASEWVGQTWHSILDQRLNAGLETIITTNYKGTDLAHMYGAWGDAIVSRLRGLCTTVILKGKDRRHG